MPTEQLLVLAMLFLPLAGFALSALVGRRLFTRAWMIAVPVIIVTWLIAMYLVYQTLLMGAFGEQGLHFTLYKWIPAGSFQILFNLAVDNLTAVLLIVVTTIGMLVDLSLRSSASQASCSLPRRPRPPALRSTTLTRPMKCTPWSSKLYQPEPLVPLP